MAHLPNQNQTHPFRGMLGITPRLGLVQRFSVGEGCLLIDGAAFPLRCSELSCQPPAYPETAHSNRHGSAQETRMNPEHIMIQLETICSLDLALGNRTYRCVSTCCYKAQNKQLCVLWGWSCEWEQLSKCRGRGRSDSRICGSSAYSTGLQSCVAVPRPGASLQPVNIWLLHTESRALNSMGSENTS